MKSFFAGLFAVVSAVAAGATILPASDTRVWQTVFDPSQPLTWRWEDSATSATLTVSNLLSGAKASAVEIERVDGAVNGTYALDYPAGAVSCGEALYDVVLAQLDEGGTVLDSQTARLAYLPGSFPVVAERRLGRMESARIAAYDSAWTDTTADAASASYTFTPTGDSADTKVLPSVSGYFAVGCRAGHLALGFDALLAVWEADLELKPGMRLIVR